MKAEQYLRDNNSFTDNPEPIWIRQDRAVELMESYAKQKAVEFYIRNFSCPDENREGVQNAYDEFNS